MATTNAERELAQSLADLLDWSARPLEGYPKHPYGTRLSIRELSHYPPVTPQNARAAMRLSAMYFAQYLRSTEATWASLPKEARRRIKVEAALIRCERLVERLK